MLILHVFYMPTIYSDYDLKMKRTMFSINIWGLMESSNFSGICSIAVCLKWIPIEGKALPLFHEVLNSVIYSYLWIVEGELNEPFSSTSFMNKTFKGILVHLK